MSPAAVVALLTELARAFGLAVPEVLRWAREQHPSLCCEPPPGEREAIDAEVDAERSPPR